MNVNRFPREIPVRQYANKNGKEIDDNPYNNVYS